MTKEIFSPAQGESITIGQQTSTFTISLSDQLLETIAMSKFEDNEVGFVRGRISINPDSSIPLLEPASHPSEQQHLAPVLSIPQNPNPSHNTLAPRQISSLPRSTIIGDLKLTMLKSRLATLGISAEFAGEGVLVCGGGSAGAASPNEDVVAVKKTGRGQVVLEGPASAVYYAVRQEVYGLHAVIAT